MEVSLCGPTISPTIQKDVTNRIFTNYNTQIYFIFAEYLDKGNYNLFFVDWSELARAPCYPSAAQNTKYAGQCIGQLINCIRDSGTEDIHIIGFSLGAHVAAFAANHANSSQVPRITGIESMNKLTYVQYRITYLIVQIFFSPSLSRPLSRSL